VPVSLSGVAGTEHEMSVALAAAHAEAVAAVRAAPVKIVDETGWKQASRLCWLWATVTETVACLQVHACRGWDGLRVLLGDAPGRRRRQRPLGGVQSAGHARPAGVLGPPEAALPSDGRTGGAAAAIGDELLCFVEDLFWCRHCIRDGTWCRTTLRRKLAELRPAVREVLERGGVWGCAKIEVACTNLLALELALWTFARVAGSSRRTTRPRGGAAGGVVAATIVRCSSWSTRSRPAATVSMLRNYCQQAERLAGMNARLGR
jgi:transposase